MDELEATEFLVDKLRGTKNNADFFDSMRRVRGIRVERALPALALNPGCKTPHSRDNPPP